MARCLAGFRWRRGLSHARVLALWLATFRSPGSGIAAPPSCTGGKTDHGRPLGRANSAMGVGPYRPAAASSLRVDVGMAGRSALTPPPGLC